MNKHIEPECINLYRPDGREESLQNRIYKADKIATALNTGFRPFYIMGGGMEDSIKIKQATKEGYVELKKGGVADFSYPSSPTSRGRVQDGGNTCPTLTVDTINGVCKVEDVYRIRKLTPCECFKLMGFETEDYKKASEVNSSSQLYKQAGNSIVVDVLEALFFSIIRLTDFLYYELLTNNRN